MQITRRYGVLLALAPLAMVLANAVPAAWGQAQPPAVDQAQQDSSKKQADQDKASAPATQEKPAQDEPASAKAEQKPDARQPAHQKQGPAEPASNSAPPAPQGPAQSGGQEAPPSGATPPVGATQAPPAEGGIEVPGTSGAPNSKPSPSANGARRRNGDSANQKRKIVVREGGTAETNALLAPSMTAEQASRQRQNTVRLLTSADAKLQKISARQLSTNQQAMVDQVRAYMQQAKDALNRGDLQRSHNLALKADLLTEDLVRH